METNKYFQSIFTSILYICGFLLFLEWLYPMQMFSDFLPLYVIIIYASFCFLISLFRMNLWLSIGCKGLGLLFLIDQLFLRTSLLKKKGVLELYKEMVFNVQAILRLDWYHLTMMFRMIMVLLLIWLMSYLIFHWFVVMQRIFVFIFLTFVYVAVLDTFTIYDGTGAIIRTFIIAFISFGLVNLLRIFTQDSREALSWMRMIGSALSIMIVVFLSAVVGYASPTYGPQWPDPIAYLTKDSLNLSSNKGGGRKMSGYREDDSILGGPFIQDHTPVFRAAAKHKNYWRMETKDVYTGKGWESSFVKDDHITEKGYVPFQFLADDLFKESQLAIVEYNEEATLKNFAYPYGAVQFNMEDVEDLWVDFSTEAIKRQSGKSLAGEVFEIEYLRPLYEADMLRQVDGEDLEDIRQNYLQIPDPLPTRVTALAEEITKDAQSRYDQAKGIEEFFRENDFTYQTTNIPYPEDGQDFVEQFLFETKRGYCDHFSTSMVVMLRTLNIPARWVKGFTGGEPLEQIVEYGDDYYDVFEITNAHAHSWVEVYFPTIGWIPFEPTKGFQNPLEEAPFTESFDEELSEKVEEKDPTDEQEEALLPSNEETPTDREAKDEREQGKKERSWMFILGAGVGLSLLVFIGWFVYARRYQLKVLYWKKKIKKDEGKLSFVETYHQLLQILDDVGHRRPTYQTLREYAKVIDQHYQTKEMQRLTEDYEQVIYDQDKAKTMNLAKDRWLRLMEHIEAKINNR